MTYEQQIQQQHQTLQPQPQQHQILLQNNKYNTQYYYKNNNKNSNVKIINFLTNTALYNNINNNQSNPYSTQITIALSIMHANSSGFNNPKSQ